VATGSLHERPVHPAGRIVLRGPDPGTQITAEATGLWNPRFLPGEVVSAGETLGEVLCCSTFQTAQTIEAPHAGLVAFNGPVLSGEDNPERQMVYLGEKIALLHRIDALHSDPPALLC
jgi:hypothetical protein